MKAIRTVQLFLLVGLTSACTPDPTAGSNGNAAVDGPAVTRQDTISTAPYTFDRPNDSFALTAVLKEISGLTTLSDGNLGAVQDEDGTFFILHPETGAIEARYPFSDTGDYEGVELDGDNRIFILRSNGSLIALTGWAAGALQTQTYETDLKRKNDTEGLVYDPTRGRLLIACKEEPGAGLDDHLRAIYAFDVASETLTSEPVFVIDQDKIEAALTNKGSFKPSALGVHPITGDLYVLSATAKALVVLDEAETIMHTWNLPESLFEQPEGLTFLPDGTLFIASEGVDGPAMLYRFTYRSKP